jgi:hypothetical protein
MSDVLISPKYPDMHTLESLGSCQDYSWETKTKDVVYTPNPPPTLVYIYIDVYMAACIDLETFVAYESLRSESPCDRV